MFQIYKFVGVKPIFMEKFNIVKAENIYFYTNKTKLCKESFASAGW